MKRSRFLAAVLAVAIASICLTSGRAQPAAAVDINPDALANSKTYLKLPAEKCYADVAQASDENADDFAIVVVSPAHHEAVVDMASSMHGSHGFSNRQSEQKP